MVLSKYQPHGIIIQVEAQLHNIIAMETTNIGGHLGFV